MPPGRRDATRARNDIVARTQRCFAEVDTNAAKPTANAAGHEGDWERAGTPSHRDALQSASWCSPKNAPCRAAEHPRSPPRISMAGDGADAYTDMSAEEFVDECAAPLCPARRA